MLFGILGANNNIEKSTFCCESQRGNEFAGINASQRDHQEPGASWDEKLESCKFVVIMHVNYDMLWLNVTYK